MEQNGRKKESPQVALCDKVNEYITYLGTENLKVKSSFPVDSIIFQSHYPRQLLHLQACLVRLPGHSFTNISFHTSQLGFETCGDLEDKSTWNFDQKLLNQMVQDRLDIVHCHDHKFVEFVVKIFSLRNILRFSHICCAKIFIW